MTTPTTGLSKILVLKDSPLTHAADLNGKGMASPALHVTPLLKETTGPKLVYRIGMGVRAADQNWKRQLNRMIQESQGEINKILLDYGVPLLDESDHLITA